MHKRAVFKKIIGLLNLFEILKNDTEKKQVKQMDYFTIKEMFTQKT